MNTEEVLRHIYGLEVCKDLNIRRKGYVDHNYPLKGVVDNLELRAGVRGSISTGRLRKLGISDPRGLYNVARRILKDEQTFNAVKLLEVFNELYDRTPRYLVSAVKEFQNGNNSTEFKQQLLYILGKRMYECSIAKELNKMTPLDWVNAIMYTDYPVRAGGFVIKIDDLGAISDSSLIDVARAHLFKK